MRDARKHRRTPSLFLGALLAAGVAQGSPVLAEAQRSTFGANALLRARELVSGQGPRKPRSLLLRALPPPLRTRVLRNALALDEASVRGVTITPAESGKDTEQASRLVHDMYAQRGITGIDPSGLRVTPYLLHPQTQVFVAKREGTVIGTISLQVDSPLGVPMEKIYGTEIGALRDSGRVVAEVGALAPAPGVRGQGMVHLLNKAMLDHARRTGVDDLVISVHPDAEDLYRDTLLFTRMGNVKPYPGLAASGLAVPLRLDLHTAPERFRAAYDARGGFDLHAFYIVGERPEIGRGRPDASARSVSRRVVSARRLLARRPQTLDEATPEQRDQLERVRVLRAPRAP